MTQAKHRENKSDHFYKTAASSGVIEFDIDKHPNQIFCTDYVASLFHWKKTNDHLYNIELIEKSIKHIEPYHRNYKLKLAQFMNHGYDNSSFAVPLSGGIWCYINIICNERTPSGSVQKATATVIDITDDINLFQHSKQLAFQDPLTKLPNKEALEYDFNDQFFQQYDFVILASIDNFKRLNEIYDYQFGDLCLQRFSKRMHSYEPDRHLFSIYRLHGSLFIITCKLKPEQDIKQWIQSFLDYSDKPYLIKNNSIQLTLTLSAIQLNKHSLNEIYFDIDQGMYMACHHGKRYHILDKQEELEELVLRQLFADPINTNNIESFAQPFFHLDSRTIIGCEFLARIIINDKLYYPDQFIDIARERNKLHEIDKIMFTKGIDYISQQISNGHIQPNFIISFNFDAQTLFQSDIISFVQNIVTNSLVPYSSILIELNGQEEIATLFNHMNAHDLRSLGINTIIHDFNAGHSSATTIGDGSFRFIKFDRQFLWDSMNTPRTEKIFASLATAFEQDKIQIIGEGVENEQQARFLQEQGFQFAQGFHFGKPCKLEQFSLLLK